MSKRRKRLAWGSGMEYATGKGGTTLLNGMIYTRGLPGYYDERERGGNPGWSFKEVLPYFLKLENMSIPELAKSSYHSTTGPVHIQYPFLTEIGRRILLAAKEMGYKIIDYNNPNTLIGFARTQTKTEGVKRHSATSAYLHPVKSRPNLHVVKNAYVTKLLTDLEEKRVYGVQFIKNYKRRTVRTTNEVIVSAGTFGSPKILLLSGIGPSNHLQEIGIPLVAELPVGYNLQDHLAITLAFLINTTDSLVLSKLMRNLQPDLLQWIKEEQGLYTSNVAETLGFVQTLYATGGLPDIELISLPMTIAGLGGAFFRRTRNISYEVFYKSYGPILFAHGFTITPMLTHPKSRGCLKLQSSNPSDPPFIDENFLTDPYDVAVLVEGIRAAIKIIGTKAFQEIGARLYTNPVHGCEHYAFNSDDYWKCVIRTIPFQYHHHCGTCRMGPHPSSSVIDPRLRVNGMKGLRVADASIMPTLPGLHTMTPCYMIGEKAADLIK